MRWQDWKPPGACRATWMGPSHLSRKERILCAALDNIISHDNAYDIRNDRPNCSEVQHGMRVLNEFLGETLWEPRE